MVGVIQMPVPATGKKGLMELAVQQNIVLNRAHIFLLFHHPR